MADEFVRGLIAKSREVSGASWIDDKIIRIVRKNNDSFDAAILKEKLVTADHVKNLVGSDVSVIANFPKVGKWKGEAIELCEAHGKAWGQWSVLLRALGSDTPEATENPEIAFNRRALSQHSRISDVRFILDHLLLLTHDSGKRVTVAMLYEYDLTSADVRKVWGDIGPFDVLLKTNPNGSIMSDAIETADSLGTRVFEIRDLLAYLGKGVF
jgi:hypothetical protein